MDKFESVIIVNPKVNEDDINLIINNVNDIIFKNGKMIKVEDIGVKKLVYEIKRNTEGHYIIFNFELDSSFRDELENYYKNNDKILKFIIYKAGED